MTRTIDKKRAMIDEDYLNALTAEERASLPANPAGDLELTESEMEEVSGAGSGCMGCTSTQSSARRL